MRTKAQAAELRASIVRAVMADKEPVKAIASEHGIGYDYAERIIRRAGLRRLLVTAEERKLILMQRVLFRAKGGAPLA